MKLTEFGDSGDVEDKGKVSQEWYTDVSLSDKNESWGHQPTKETQGSRADLWLMGEKETSFRQAEFEVPVKHISVSQLFMKNNLKTP